jgi:hypothetical protein
MPSRDPICRLCGLVIRPTDHAAWLADEYFHAPCAEPAFEGTPAWQHMKIGDLNLLAQGMGRAAM